MGYKITTIYVTTESPEINLERIAKRGRDNDTYLTPERVRGRYKRSLDLLSEFIKRSDMALAFDNSINYFAVFYKTPEGKNYLIGETEWANRYIVEKLQKEGIQLYTAKDMDKETYVRLLNEANRLIVPSAKRQAEQDGQARQVGQAEQDRKKENTKENLTAKDKEIIDRIRKSPKGAEFDRLFSGRETGEQAGARMLNMLAFFTDQNPEQMARIYKASALYEPSKGEEYLNGAISKSLEPYNRQQNGFERPRSRGKSGDRGNGK